MSVFVIETNERQDRLTALLTDKIDAITEQRDRARLALEQVERMLVASGLFHGPVTRIMREGRR